MRCGCPGTLWESPPEVWRPPFYKLPLVTSVRSLEKEEEKEAKEVQEEEKEEKDEEETDDEKRRCWPTLATSHS